MKRAWWLISAVSFFILNESVASRLILARPHPRIPANTAQVERSAADSVLVDFSSEPPGAEIMVDGNPVGNTPSQQNLAPGRHQVDIRLPGYRSWSRQLRVYPGSKIIAIRAVLAKE